MPKALPATLRFNDPALMAAFRWVADHLHDDVPAVTAAAPAVSASTGLSVDPGLDGVLHAERGIVRDQGQHTDLGGVTADQHHAQAHEVLDTDDHSDAVVGLEFYLRGLADGDVLTWDATNGYWYNKAP